MTVSRQAVTDPGFITLCIQLAQSTFSDVMPLKAGAGKEADRPMPVAGHRNWMSAIADWFHRQEVAEREAYLARSVDIYDLERRMRQFDRHPYY